MNMFYRRSINEYRRQISLKKSFTIQTARLRESLDSAEQSDFDGQFADRSELSQHLRLLLLSPLVEIAWADGRVTRGESNAIFEVAEAYGLFKDDAQYCKLLENLTSRPVPQTVGRMWQDFYRLFEYLPEFAREDIAFCLNVQARFVAEQSSDNLVSFLRGERISASEQEALLIIKQQLENALAAAKAIEEKRNAAVRRAEAQSTETREIPAPAADFFGEFERQTATIEDYAVLVPLVPLVKTAWAEGRITKRERHLIFEAASRMGVKPGTPARRRLESWLELHPTEDFYIESLERLNADWLNLPEEERVLRRLDLLSDCVNIAEASGGTNRYPAGGARVCDEEFEAIKRISRKLNSSSSALSA
jgi:uncharacterized tellurite resistance protein B-like protein